MDDYAKHNLIVYAFLNLKLEVEVTNNRRLCLTYYTVEANYWHKRSITRAAASLREQSLFEIVSGNVGVGETVSLCADGWNGWSISEF